MESDAHFSQIVKDTLGAYEVGPEYEQGVGKNKDETRSALAVSILSGAGLDQSGSLSEQCARLREAGYEMTVDALEE